MQVHDIKHSLDGRHIARVRIPEKRRTFRNHYSSDEEDTAAVCRYCGFKRKHKAIDDCPAYGQICHKCQKWNHFASVCKSRRCKDNISNQKKKRIRSINKSNRMQKTCETDTSDSSDDDFVSKSAAHMLRIETLKSVSCVEEENETGACSLENGTANRWDQHKQCKEEIALMRYELERHLQEMEMKLERTLSELIAQMGTLICTEARDFSRDETENLQLKDEIGNTSLRKSNMSEIIERKDIPQIHGQNQNCLCENTNQTIDLHSQKGSEEERRTEDSDQEDSFFIEANIRTPSTKVARDSSARRKKKKRKGKP